MPNNLRRNAVVLPGLVALFYWSFQFAKHDPALRDIIPFGEDPYDAIGSFAVLIAPLVALISVVRAFRPYGEPAPSPSQLVYLARTQAAVVLPVEITLVADAVAMARHPGMWIGAASRNRLIALLGVLALAVVAAHLLIRATLPQGSRSRGPGAASAALLALLILAVYPERVIHATATHLFTVVAGAALLFAPMRPLLTALVPYDEGETGTTRASSRFFNAPQRWGAVLLVGLLIGGFLFLAEMRDGAPPTGRLLFVASVYVGLAITGLLIAYASLGKPLGLAARRN